MSDLRHVVVVVWFAQCRDCGRQSSRHAVPEDARTAAREANWSDVSGHWRCPRCDERYHLEGRVGP
jgi:rubredoxin